LRKILIISYFFPPCNFVGAQRTSSWVKHLHKKGYFPIIVTRQWNEGQTDIVDKVDNNEMEHLTFDSNEVYRMPNKRTLRDRCSEYKFLRPIQKLLSFIEIVFSNFFIKALPYSNIYQKARNILHDDPSIRIVIASGRPFQSFYFGYLLKKEFDIHWIPDYRDEWTSHQNPTDKSFLWKFIHKLEKRSEKKWTSNADGFITVSDHWQNSIGTYIEKPGHVVMNGYDRIHPLTNRKYSNDVLNIVYAGTLYPSQPIEIFIKAFQRVSVSSKIKINVTFIGANLIPSEIRRLKNLKGNSSNIEFLNRMPKSRIIQEMQKADVLLLTAFENVTGWYAAKLFEYYASGTPILLCPTDNDIMESFIKKTNCGVSVNSVNECEEVLLNWSNAKMNGESILFDRNIEEGKKFSREHQTYELASYLDKFSNNPE